MAGPCSRERLSPCQASNYYCESLVVSSGLGWQAMCISVHCSVSVSLDQPTLAHPMTPTGHCQPCLLVPSLTETSQPELRPVIGHWRSRPTSSAKEKGALMPCRHGIRGGTSEERPCRMEKGGVALLQGRGGKSRAERRGPASTARPGRGGMNGPRRMEERHGVKGGLKGGPELRWWRRLGQGRTCQLLHGQRMAAAARLHGRKGTAVLASTKRQSRCWRGGRGRLLKLRGLNGEKSDHFIASFRPCSAHAVFDSRTRTLIPENQSPKFEACLKSPICVRVPSSGGIYRV